MLGKPKVAEPGLRVVMPGKGVIRIWPVSVIHHVSTTGQRSAPITSRYQTHASGLIGSPTVPSTRRLDRSCRAGYSLPHFMNVRIAVGAVYRMLTPYFWTIDQKRSLSGKSGEPSYMTHAAPLAIGPYTMYEWPVTQPISAVHQYTSSSFRSKTYLWVQAVPTR